MWVTNVHLNLEQVYISTMAALDSALGKMAAVVPAPQPVKTASGSLGHRYTEATSQQALVLKTVRTLSALRSAKLLIDAGLVLDAGASLRMLDELGSDIMFLAGPLVTLTPPEPRHAEYLVEFFQEEFDHPDPLQSTQNRRRVSRRHIRAHVARTFSAGFSVSDIVAVTETIDNAFSGYVHGAAVHIMDVYDGYAFCVPVDGNEGPVASLREQYPQYLHRALMAVALAAKGIGNEDLFAELYRVLTRLFDDFGDIR